MSDAPAQSRYQPGDRLLVCAGARWILLPQDQVPNAEELDALVAELRSDEPLDVQRLPVGSDAFELLPVRTLVGRATVGTPEGEQSGTPAELASLLDDAIWVRLGAKPSVLAGTDGPGWPISSGVVRAASVLVQLAVPADAEAATPLAEPEPAHDSEPESQPGPEPEPEPVLSANRTAIWHEATGPAHPEPADATPPEPESSLIDGIPPGLWTSTNNDAAGKPAESAPAPADPAPQAVSLPPVSPAGLPSIPSLPTVPPLLPPLEGTPAHPAAQPDVDEDELRQTVDRRALPPQPAGEAVETVLAAQCPLGHTSPAFAPACRVCGQPIQPQQPRSIPRPTLGRLALPDHEMVDLDRGVIFGRAPRELEGSPERPHLINIARYGDYLSRMHLAIELQGWHVLARDLGSTSGTTVTLPGRQPETLRANEPLALEPGAVVDLAGSYVFRFEVVG